MCININSVFVNVVVVIVVLYCLHYLRYVITFLCCILYSLRSVSFLVLTSLHTIFTPKYSTVTYMSCDLVSLIFYLSMLFMSYYIIVLHFFCILYDQSLLFLFTRFTRTPRHFYTKVLSTPLWSKFIYV